MTLRMDCAFTWKTLRIDFKSSRIDFIILQIDFITLRIKKNVNEILKI